VVKQYPARTLRETAEGKYWKRFAAPSVAKQVCISGMNAPRRVPLCPGQGGGPCRQGCALAVAAALAPAAAPHQQQPNLNRSPPHPADRWRLTYRLLPAAAISLCHHSVDTGEGAVAEVAWPPPCLNTASAGAPPRRQALSQSLPCHTYIRQ
jgi:hypothetical protein